MPESADLNLTDAVDRKVSSVRTRQLDLSFNEMVDMYTSQELVVAPEYQRLFRWTEGAQSRFIESLILELPLPPIFLMETDEGIYELIDGLQRISSFLHFRGELVVDGEKRPPLRLSDCDIVTELNGRTYDDLPAALERRLKRNFVRAEILRRESDRRLRYYMFKRLNSGGEPLEAQEIRNCTIRLLDPGVNDLLIELSQLADFKSTISTVSPTQVERKYDQELVLRFLAFKNRPDGYVHEVGDFLTEFMEGVSDPGLHDGTGDEHPEWKRLDAEAERAVFSKTFRVLARAAESNTRIQDRIFGAVDVQGRIRGQFAVYHFEGLTLGIQPLLDRLDPDSDDQMSALGEAIFVVKTTPELRNHTGGGKNTREAFKRRVNFFTESLDSLVD